ncbi:MAG: fibrobacter succinogenes major paralogous domain-containing protein [Prevotellaceae bacterium]|nr:fibrobacter succinogenes major paralogous domain-containing protein [Prevotellaceae bacterium]
MKYGYFLSLSPLLLATALFTGVGEKPESPVDSTVDVGVTVNGVKWATRNVATPGHFVDKPEDTGMFYQWNNKTGWSSTDPAINSDGNTIWDNTEAAGTVWEAANDPCPDGWRVPAQDELESLAKSGSEWTSQTSVNGSTFGSGNSTVFFPVTGCRDYSNGTVNTGNFGRYWSSTANGAYARSLTFTGNYVNSDITNFRAYGFSVRCVAE